MPDSAPDNVNRRDFMRTTAVIAAAGMAAPVVHAGGRDEIRVGVIGCGGRGTGAAFNALEADEAVRIVAMADLFPDRLEGSHGRLTSTDNPNAARVDVPTDRRFTGFTAYQDLIDATELDVVILATPPHFRPMCIEAAIEADVNVFTEKPVAVDAPGIRKVLKAAKRAKEKNLSIVAGTQRRHERSYLEAMERVRDGAIGEIVSANCYWNQGGLWVKKPRAEWSDMEWQIRNWLYFTWLSGDHITEQHVHNLDVVNWAMDAHPVRALGMGGRQSRTAPEYGQIFDHFAIELEYPNGVHALSMCRQADGAANRVQERIFGTKGRLTTSPGQAVITGANEWRFEGPNPNPYVQEHRDLIASIRSRDGHNELVNVANATMTAILGRTSAYTGQELTWEEMMESQLDLSPPAYEFGPIDVPPVAIPGRTKFV